MTFTKITTAGAGTMGSQVAWQMAFHGKQYADHFITKRGASESLLIK